MTAGRDRLFSRAAEGYDAHAGAHREISARLAAAFAAHVPVADLPRGAVLDIGCGTGLTLAAFRSALPALQNRCAAGADNALAMCGRFRARHASVAAICADMRAMPFRPGCAALFCSAMALQWADAAERPALWRRWHAAAAPGAALAVAVPVSGSLKAFYAMLRRAGGMREFIFPEAETLTREIEAAGFLLCHHETADAAFCFDTPADMLRYTKKLGGNIAGGTVARYPGKAFPARFASAFAEAADGEGGVCTSWRVLYIIARKEG